MNGAQLAAEALRLLKVSSTRGTDVGAAGRNIARAQVYATLADAAARIDAADRTTMTYTDADGQDRVDHEPANAAAWREVFAPEEPSDG